MTPQNILQRYKTIYGNEDDISEEIYYLLHHIKIISVSPCLPSLVMSSVYCIQLEMLHLNLKGQFCGKFFFT